LTAIKVFITTPKLKTAATNTMGAARALIEAANSGGITDKDISRVKEAVTKLEDAADAAGYQVGDERIPVELAAVFGGGWEF